MTRPIIGVGRVDDFDVTGDGTSAAWSDQAWLDLSRVGRGTATYETRARVAYSEHGLYFFVECKDKRLTCTMTEDYDDIYNEDVVEVFLWPDESQPLYFEYEVSPLEVQLPILVPHKGSCFMGWRPWHFEGDRLTAARTTAFGGPKESMAKVDGWTAEFFIPFALLTGLGNVPPVKGSIWRANIYRIDYDETPESHWAWSPDTGANFHNHNDFGVFEFA